MYPIFEVLKSVLFRSGMIYYKILQIYLFLSNFFSLSPTAPVCKPSTTWRQRRQRDDAVWIVLWSTYSCLSLESGSSSRLRQTFQLWQPHSGTVRIVYKYNYICTLVVYIRVNTLQVRAWQPAFFCDRHSVDHHSFGGKHSRTDLIWNGHRQHVSLPAKFLWRSRWRWGVLPLRQQKHVLLFPSDIHRKQMCHNWVLFTCTLVVQTTSTTSGNDWNRGYLWQKRSSRDEVYRKPRIWKRPMKKLEPATKDLSYLFLHLFYCGSKFDFIVFIFCMYGWKDRV